MSSSVGSDLSQPTHDISLSDGKDTYGFMLQDGVASFIETSQTGSTLLNRGGANKWGDYDPTMAQVEQRSIIGGRGSKDFSEDPTRFWDSKNLFSMVDGKYFPAPQWKVSTGLRTTHEELPGDVAWQPLSSSYRYLASSFTVGDSNLGADNVGIWIRRIGSPGTLTVQIWSDDSGPDALVTDASDTVTTSTIDDYESIFYNFDLSDAADLTATVTYWVVVFGASTDNVTNHWEIAVDDSGSDSDYSSDGSSWSNATVSIYYRVMDAHTDRKFKFFEMYGALWAVDILASGGASTLYLNGEIGVATAGTTTSLTDSNEGEDGTWTENQWQGWYVKVISGTAKGQSSEITANTDAGVLTISFDIAPAAGDVYVIYGGDAWQSFASGTTGLGNISEVAVANNIAYFAQGSGDNIRRITYVSGSHAMAYDDDGTNKADKLHVFHDPIDGPVIWRAENDDVDVSRADVAAWGTDLSFGTEIDVGEDNADIVNIIDYDKKLWVFKEDGVYTINSDRAERLNVGLDFIKTSNNGEAAIAHKLFMIFSWGNFTVQRYYGADLSSIGYERNYGLPSNRKGKCTALHSHPAGLFACVDAGSSGYSSVLVREEQAQGWHEIFRSPVAGWQVRDLFWQDCPSTQPRLWIECNGEIFYQEWPEDTFNPLEDTLNYQHEAVLEFADIDMGAARLPKAIKELNLISENLTDGIEVFMDYKVDDESTWLPAGRFSISPWQALPINESEIRKINIRLRLYTNDADVPPIVEASVLEGILRTPFKRQWTFRVRASDFQVTKIGVPDSKPSDLLNFLYACARNTTFVTMRALFDEMDDIRVIVEPPTVRRTSVLPQTQTWSGMFEFTVREA